jgi:hypothetical protein
MAGIKLERAATDTSPNGVYSRFRNDLLSMTAERRIREGLHSTPEAPIWGILMEFGYEGASVTLFATADSKVSLFFSNGGAFLGGGLHEEVHEAVPPFFDEANRSCEQMTPATSFPPPEVGGVIFYCLTDAGVQSAGALKKDLVDDRHPLSALYHAGHGVLTPLRKRAEQGKHDGPSAEREPGKKACPHCGKALNVYAVKCRFCKADL